MNKCIKKIALLVFAILCQMQTTAMAHSDQKNTKEKESTNHSEFDHGGTGGCGSGLVK